MSNYTRYLEDEDRILLDTTKYFNPQEYKKKSRILTAMLKAVAIKLPHRTVNALRKRYLRLHGIVKSNAQRREIKRQAILAPGPKASYAPPPVQVARTEPIDDNWFIKPPSREQMMSRRG